MILWYGSIEMGRRAGLTRLPEDVRVWPANYNGDESLDSVRESPYWNPDQVVGHQYTSDPVDLSVFNPVWRQNVAEPTIEETPASDEVAALVNKLGYLQGDVANAIENELNEIEARLGVARAALSTLRNE